MKSSSITQVKTDWLTASAQTASILAALHRNNPFYQHILYKFYINVNLSTEPKSSWSEGTLVSGAGVLVGRDGHELQDPFSPSPVHATWSKVN